MSSVSVPPLASSTTTKPVIHINISEIGTFAKIGQLQPTYAFNLDIATRRSAKDIARDRLYDTGFPRVTRGVQPDAEMIETARRSVSAREPRNTTNSARSTSNKSPAGSSAASKELARELDAISGGGGFNLSLLSSSRYYHSAQSTLNGQSEASKRSPRNSARAFIQQQTQLPYGREAFDGISDTADSLYDYDFSRRYKLNAPTRYASSMEVLKNENRPNLRNLPIAPLGTTHSRGTILAGAGVSGGTTTSTSTNSNSGNNNNSNNSSRAGSSRGGITIPNLNQNNNHNQQELPKYYTQTSRGKEQMNEIMTKGLPRRETATISSGYF
jgi:hypothetical protein